MSEGDDGPSPVDFDALHAALGSMPAPEVSSSPDLPQPRELPGQGDSHGRSSATYASAQPRAVPKAHVTKEAADIPAVIVHNEDTVPTASPKMTQPMPPPPSHPSGPYNAAREMPGMMGPPSSGPHPSAPQAYLTPAPFPVQAIPNSSHTVRMPERPRTRARVPTIVVRPRGPSTRQKLVAFLLMFVVIVAGGFVGLFFLRPQLLGLERESLVPTTSVPPIAPPPVSALPAAVPTMTATATATYTATTPPPAVAGGPTATPSSKPKPKPAQAPLPRPITPPSGY